MTSRIGGTIAALFLAFAAGGAAACPVCDSETGRQVRDGLVDGDFVRNVLAVVLPFAAVGGVVAAVHFGWPLNRRRDGRERR